MSTSIRLKHSSTSGSAPSAENLVAGEIAINTADVKAYIKNSSGQIVQLAGKGIGVDSISAGTNISLEPESGVGDVTITAATQAGTTNLSVPTESHTGTQLVIASDTGTNATLSGATTNLAGLLTATDKVKLNSAITNAGVTSISAGTNITLEPESGTGAVTISAASGTGVTNLSIANRGVNTLDIASDTGTNATIQAATTELTGLLTAADKTKLDAALVNITAGTNVTVTPTQNESGDVIPGDLTVSASTQTGTTNLSIANRGTETLDIASSTGTNATIQAATTSLAGLLTAADKTALDGAMPYAINNLDPLPAS